MRNEHKHASGFTFAIPFTRLHEFGRNIFDRNCVGA